MDGRRGIREAVCNLLRAQGFDCDSSGDGQAALRRLKGRKTPDIIITEHSLPQVDAFSLASTLRQLGFDGKIFIHANQLDPEEEIECARNHVDRLVVRPGALADLLEELEQSFEPPRAEELDGARLAGATRRSADSPVRASV